MVNDLDVAFAGWRADPTGRLDMDVLQDLVDSEDLDSAILKNVPTFDMDETKVEWDLAWDGRKLVELSTFAPGGCPNSYLCVLRPGSAYCDTKK